MSFYERYAFLCRQKGIDPCSQATADMLGVTKGTISAWKRNDNAPKGGTVSAIADALGVSADYLWEDGRSKRRSVTAKADLPVSTSTGRYLPAYR